MELGWQVNRQTGKDKERKMMKQGKAMVAGVILAVGCFTSSYADSRSYVWTYEYSTMPKGIAELEYYLTTDVPDTGDSRVSTWQHQIELEYGLTDDWDIGLYQVFKDSHGTNDESSLEYEGFKIKSRYKLAKPGAFVVDPLLYVEYIRASDLDEPDVLEAKLVLARDLGNINVAYNAIVERELDGDAETEHEYAAGVSYALTSGLSAGLEAKGSYSEHEHAAGPVLSVETDKLWFTLGAVFGLNDETEDLQARMIAGFAF
jgi:hypothetical protein